jgi:outer membrane biosynthesis protein TonB
MKGIAITLATSADAEAVAGIEKLLGHKIARVGGKTEAPREARPAARSKPEKAPPVARPSEPTGRRRKAPPRDEAPQPRAEPRADREPAPKHEPAPKREPVVEDISNEWNGPLPGFLSVGAS